MKIGILTYFDGINFGAFAQVYALHKRLEKLGFNNKVIAYKNPKHIKNELKSLFFTKNIGVFLSNLIKFFKFRSLQKSLDTTVHISDARQINGLGLDVVIVGSDEVWNFKNDLFGIDGAYFGIPFTNVKLISYAGCFGKVGTEETVPDNLIEGLKKFQSLSVRDDNSYSILKKTLHKEAQLVLDPTLLYDYTDEISNVETSIEEYLLFYGINFENHSEKIIENIKEFAKSKGLKIISVGFKHHWADQNIASITPFEWMKYIQNASFVVTNMFHGTVFSIKFNKQFLTIGSERRKNKVESLLKHMDLLDRVVYFNNLNDSITETLDSKIDFNRVNEIIAHEKKKSEDFLIHAIGSD